MLHRRAESETDDEYRLFEELLRVLTEYSSCVASDFLI